MAVALKSLVEQQAVSIGKDTGDLSDQRQIAYCSRTDCVWVLDANGQSITLLDGTRGDVVGMLAMHSAPQACCFDDNTGLAYVILLDDKIAILDQRTGALVQAVRLAPGSQPRSMLPLLNRQRIYVLNYRAPGSGLRGDIAVLDTRTNAVVKTIPAGYGPF